MYTLPKTLWFKRVTLLLLILLTTLLLTSGSKHPESKAKSARVIYSKASKNTVYITIDDGYYLNYKARALIIKNKLPVTFFITASLFKFKKYHAYYQPLLNSLNTGNHTQTHPNLNKISSARVNNEICTASRTIKKTYGFTPLYFRTPYGLINAEVKKEASKCGFESITLWNASFYHNHLSTYGGPLKAGDIIILHTNKYLDTDLSSLLGKIKKLGLKPGYLNQ